MLTAIGLSSAAFGQTHVIHTSKTFTVAPTMFSTFSIQPQIQPTPPFVISEVAAENDSTPPLPREKANNLRAGGFLGKGRGILGRYFPGPVDGRYVPPDCNMAVGPNQIVVTINTTIAFYSKSGTQIFKSVMDGANGFFSGTAQTNFVFDPRCFYDPIAKRFFVLADDLDEANNISNVLVAVSDDDNPSGNWFKYRIPAALTVSGTGYWMDYPTLGFNKDAIAITGNMFGFSSGYFGVEALVLPKAPLLTGGTATINVLQDPGDGTVQPMRTTDKTINKIFCVAQGGGNAMRFFALSNLTSSPTLSEFDVPTPAYSRPPGPAPSGSNTIDSLDGRVMSCQYRNGQVVSAHTIGTGNGIGIRWENFNVNSWPTSGTPTLKQSGTISAGNAAMHMPGIAMNSFEDISVVYTRSSSSIAADLCISSRTKNDPAGQIGTPVKLSGSQSANYQSFRWGDYFGCEVDPSDDATFWGFGMTIDGSGGYATQIVTWTVTPPGGANGNPITGTNVTPFVGSYILGDDASVALADGIPYMVGSAGIPQFGQAAGIQADFIVPTDTAHLTADFLTTAGVAGGTNMLWLYNWQTGVYDLIGSTPLAASGTVQKFISVLDAKVSKYIGPGGLVRADLRGHFPIKPLQNNLPLPFTYQIDLFQLVVRN